jgi:hypothetical protein
LLYCLSAFFASTLFLLPSHGICIRNWESLWLSLAVAHVNLINVPLLCTHALSCCLRHQAVCSSTHLLHFHFPGEHLLFQNTLLTKHRTYKHYYDFKLRVVMMETNSTFIFLELMPQDMWIHRLIYYVISGFLRRLNEIFALLGCYAALIFS